MINPSDSVIVVTSCSLDGWNRYGAKGVATLLQYWPPEVHVHLVSEDVLPLDAMRQLACEQGRLMFWDLGLHERATGFYEQHRKNNTAKGHMHTHYDFRKDAWRFSKKVFAIEMVARYTAGGRLIWLDADTVTLSPVPMEMLQRMPPNEFSLAFLDRSRKYHSECGFVGYNLNRDDTRNFIATFADLYVSGEVFKLKEWHDSWVFDWVRHHTRIAGYGIPHNNNSHPFVHSELGKYMDHLKGARKTLGISVDHPRFKRAKG